MEVDREKGKGQEGRRDGRGKGKGGERRGGRGRVRGGREVGGGLG